MNWQDVIIVDNVLVQVEISVFYCIIELEKIVYCICDIDVVIVMIVVGIVWLEIGMMELDQVQLNCVSLIECICELLVNVVDDWGIEVMWVEILDVNLDDVICVVMLQQLNVECVCRVQVIEVEGKCCVVELVVDGEFYVVEQQVKVKCVLVDVEVYVINVIVVVICDGGFEVV